MSTKQKCEGAPHTNSVFHYQFTNELPSPLGCKFDSNYLTQLRGNSPIAKTSGKYYVYRKLVVVITTDYLIYLFKENAREFFPLESTTQ